MSQPLADINDSELEALLETAHKPVLVAFHTPDCPYCARQAPLLETAAQTWAAHATFVRLDASTNETRPRHGLTGTPTLALYIDGEEQLTKTGAMREQQLRAFLNAYLPDAAGPRRS